ncbi:hypothetical protein H6G17_25125 [Chroococcidiopsis sp. FACHB-1243]|uniref:hypothetical protein n=1 Tax=Chroococcidiopsis sp. [FACHB-1243] TaxID=2692781 RepID=UPI00177F20AE|nr:hypothetical protein [Chroococcidiopsis sp. [FACHB-1243]]MBD2308756.1 hypothetical protein [Chroococcidiopsis sp. [FACHB-1243]]
MKLCKPIAMATLIIMGLNGQSVLADNKRAIPIVGLWVNGTKISSKLYPICITAIHALKQ